MFHVSAAMSFLGPVGPLLENGVRAWRWSEVACFAAAVTLGMEALAVLLPTIFTTREQMPTNKAKHLDRFEARDWTYVYINKVLTVVFVYHFCRLIWLHPGVEWSLDRLTLLNSAGSLVAFYCVYDLPYTVFHRMLHHRSIYRYIHKHHHRQIVPTRGNYDAINVHPFEFVVGEYMHLLAIYIVPCHVITVLVFLVLSGVLASLNHTRFLIKIPFLYDTKNHDVHHQLFDYNFGQYSMLYDKAFGWFRAYEQSSKRS